MLFLPTATAILSATLLFTLTTALPQLRPSDVLDARQENRDEYENFLAQWLEKHGETLAEGTLQGDKAKRNQVNFKHYEDTYADLLAERLKRLGRVD